MMLTPPLALKVHEPYIRHESGESTFLVALFLVDQATRFVMMWCYMQWCNWNRLMCTHYRYWSR